MPSLAPWVTGKEALVWVMLALELTDVQAEPILPAGDHTDTLTEKRKRERQDRQTTSCASAGSKTLCDNL